MGNRKRSPLRIAYDNADYNAMKDMLLQQTIPDKNGCMVWTGRQTNSGYATTTIAMLPQSPHRIIAKAIHGNIDGLVVHHKCANRLCLNPEHLQAVTADQNTAEMMARKKYERRIAALEYELRRIDPKNPIIS